MECGITVVKSPVVLFNPKESRLDFVLTIIIQITENDGNSR